jgi:GDSL-like Lipase/Acylhydrolase family
MSARAPAPPGSEQSGPVPGRKRSVGRGELVLALAAFALVPIILVVAELTVRFTRDAPEGSLGPLHAYSEVYGWAPRKSFRMVYDGKVTTINAQGYRGAGLPPSKARALRIVLLGDSIAFGLEVGDDETFAAVLSSRRHEVEVANLAVQGYDPGQELIRLEREGLPLKPDVVILSLCVSNDLADVSLPVFLYDGRHPKPFFTVEGGQLVEHADNLRLSFRQEAALYLLEHSRLYALLAARSKVEEDEGGEVEHWTVRRRKALRDRGRAIEITSRLLGRMADDCRKRGVKFIVAAFPDKRSFRLGSGWLEQVRSSPELQGVPFVDMAARFRSRQMDFQAFAMDGIGHLSPNGHRVAAEILNDVLVEEGLLADDTQPATGAGSPAGS